MSATTEFFVWFFQGLNGLGGWFLFFLFAFAAVIWLFYDSNKRKLPAAGWKLGIALISLLIIPAIIFRFVSADTQASLAQFSEVIFYLGLLGGLLPVVLGVGYFLTFRGMITCEKGHLYEEVLGRCPECARDEVADRHQIPMPIPMPDTPIVQRVDIDPVGPVVRHKPKTQAWLVSDDGKKNYQLCAGETTIGRSADNDILLDGDSTVSRQHAKIVEQNSHFRIFDLGSAVGTRVNGRRLREPVLLESDDKVEFGDNTTLVFITRR